jgi:enoyl-CoA hydratase
VPEAFARLDEDDEVRAVIVFGRGDDFSFGLDLPAMMGELEALSGEGQLASDRMALLALIERLQGAFDAIARCRAPVIAAIHGRCIGGGLDLVAACDIRLCEEGASFSLREVKLSMVADLGSLQRIPRIIGSGHARELAFTGKDIDAAHALRIGLCNACYADKDSLLAAAREMAREIAENSPLAVQGVKRVMNHAEGRPVDEGLAHVALWNAAFLPSKDLAEALLAFREKRPPRFTGK